MAMGYGIVPLLSAVQLLLFLAPHLLPSIIIEAKRKSGKYQ